MKRFLFTWLLALGFVALTSAMPASAQATNLLADPGLENEQFLLMSADPTAGVTFSVPFDWRGGVILSPQTESWMNQHPTGFPHTAWIKREGGRSLHIARGGATFTAFIYQQVSVAPGSALRGGAWAYIEGNPTGLVRAGIDPTGSTNPFSPDIVWSGWGNLTNTWNLVQVETTAVGGTATLFLWAQQSEPSDPNGVYWDETFLFGTPGSGPVTEPEVAPETNPGGTLEAVPTTRLNVRSGPATTFDVIGVAVPGTGYAVINQQGGWIEIAYGGGTGWISADFVRPLAPATAPPAPGGPLPPPTGISFTASYTLNLRAASGTGSAVIGEVPFEATVSAVGRSADNNWVQVVYEDQVGWLAAWLGTVSGGSFLDLPVVP